MSGRAFFDTNIFIYLYASQEPEKQSISKTIIDNAADCISSTQILNEVNNVLIRKWRMPLDVVRSVQRDIRCISNVAVVTEQTIDAALDLCEKYGYSYYDCLMLASAL